MVKVRKDLTGMRFGKLTVLRQAEDSVSPGGQHHAAWWCQCDCQRDKEFPEETYIVGYYLTSGDTTSCGCYHKEQLTALGRSNKTTNRYEKRDGYYIGYTDKDEPFYFDECDFDLISKYKWHKREDGYICSYSDNRKRTMLHRLIMGLSKTDNSVVDHILGNETRNDNRRYNLRIATSSQNNMNTKIKQNNKSGITGVCFDKIKNKWRAYITINKKHIDLGFFNTKEEAMVARKSAEEKYFGKWSYANSQKIGEEALQKYEDEPTG